MANLNEKTKFICGRNPLAKNNRPSFAHPEQQEAALWLTDGTVNPQRSGKASYSGGVTEHGDLLSFQLDSAEIYAQGLRFFPLCYVPEVCIFFYAEEEIPQGPLRLAQVLPYRWLPIKEMYQTLYETELLQEGARRGVDITPPGTIRSARYGGPSLKMVPLLYYRRPDLRFARLLDWNKGHRFGIVAGQKADDPVVRGYVQALQQAFPALTGPLFGVELEKIEV